MEQELSAFAIALIAFRRTKLKRRVVRKCWTKDWLRRRSELGAGSSLMAELALEEPLDFRNYMRMDVATFSDLLNRVSPLIVKKDTNMRDIKQFNFF